jgi:hypothetical protein
VAGTGACTAGSEPGAGGAEGFCAKHKPAAKIQKLKTLFIESNIAKNLTFVKGFLTFSIFFFNYFHIWSFFMSKSMLYMALGTSVSNLFW